jgi:hypothetical protein
VVVQVAQQLDAVAGQELALVDHDRLRSVGEVLDQPRDDGEAVKARASTG